MTEVKETGLLLKYFVLKPRGTSAHAKASREAMLTYATWIKEEDSSLASSLRRWVSEEEATWKKEVKHDQSAN